MKSKFLFWMHISVVKNHSIGWAQSKRKRLSFCKPQVVKQVESQLLTFPQRLSKLSMVPSYKILNVVLFPYFKEIFGWNTSIHIPISFFFSVHTALNACAQLRHVLLRTKLHVSAVVFACFGPVIPAATPACQQWHQSNTGAFHSLPS